MDRSQTIKLISTTKAQDERGVWKVTEAAREVFCNVQSVTASEFFEGGRNGLKPEYKFVMFFGDYNGEQIVVYKGHPYGVYRTYHASTDVLELYAERKAGVVLNEDPDNGDENSD